MFEFVWMTLVGAAFLGMLIGLDLGMSYLLANHKLDKHYKDLKINKEQLKHMSEADQSFFKQIIENPCPPGLLKAREKLLHKFNVIKQKNNNS